MFLNLGIPIGSLLFLSVSIIIYIVKKKYHDFQNRLFKYLLIITYVLLLLEIAYVITIHNMEKIPLLNDITCRLYLTGIIIWIFTFFFYIFSIGIIKMHTNKKNEIETYIPWFIIGCSLLFTIISLFFSISYEITNGFYIITGSTTYFVYSVFALLMIILFIFILKNRKHYTDSLKIPMFFTIFMIMIDIVQLFAFHKNNLPLVLSLVVSSLYFTIESQDRMLLKEVAEAKKKSEEINKSKTEFLSNMSHEIRTPMNTILGFCNSLLLEKKLTKEKVMEDAANINKASNNLLELINNILDISKIESGKSVINEKDYELSNVLTDINKVLILNSQGKDIWHDLDVNWEMPSKYHGDYAKIIKIVNSVIKIITKYCDKGYMNVSVDNEQQGDNNYMIFIIKNFKSNLSADFCNKDFSDFSKLDYSQGNRMDSEFLGLVIAKRLINMMEDSSIVFKRENNEMIECIIKINQKVIDKEHIGDNYLSINSYDSVDCSHKKALVVDDNEINLKLAERLLKKYNFKISKATSGSECINMVKVDDFDIIFLDHMMPGLDGIHTMQILKNMKKKVPFIIAMTANSNIDSKDFYEKEGFDDYIGKPINKNRLDRLISDLFGGRS